MACAFNEITLISTFIFSSIFEYYIFQGPWFMIFSFSYEQARAMYGIKAF